MLQQLHQAPPHPMCLGLTWRRFSSTRWPSGSRCVKLLQAWHLQIWKINWLLMLMIVNGYYYSLSFIILITIHLLFLLLMAITLHCHLLFYYQSSHLFMVTHGEKKIWTCWSARSASRSSNPVTQRMKKKTGEQRPNHNMITVDKWGFTHDIYIYIQ